MNMSMTKLQANTAVKETNIPYQYNLVLFYRKQAKNMDCNKIWTETSYPYITQITTITENTRKINVNAADIDHHKNYSTLCNIYP